MNKEAYIQQITDMIQDCKDADVLDLIYKILLHETCDQPGQML